jgi:CRP-like cAMP-binding protein
MTDDTVSALRKVPLFSTIKDRELRSLAGTMKEQTFEPGATLTTEGRGGAGFFVLLDGSATVRVGDQERRVLHAGDSFGEIALLDGGARTATVTADTKVRTAGLTSWEFKPFVETHGEVAWELLRTLAARLREADSSS